MFHSEIWIMSKAFTKPFFKIQSFPKLSRVQYASEFHGIQVTCGNVNISSANAVSKIISTLHQKSRLIHYYKVRNARVVLPGFWKARRFPLKNSIMPEGLSSRTIAMPKRLCIHWDPQEMDDHQSYACEKRIVHCPKPGCEEKMEYEKLVKEHFLTCNKRMIFCKGCLLPVPI